MPWYLCLPLASALLYALASILIKRALKEGATADQAFHISNLLMAITFLPLCLLETREVQWQLWWRPVVTAAFFFVGNLTTILAIHRSDVSLVTPLMGTKVVFVALAVVYLFGQQVSSGLWIAAGLTAIGIFLMGYSDFRKNARGAIGSICTVLCSAVFFAIHDVLVAYWAVSFGPMMFLSIEMQLLLLLSTLWWVIQGRPRLRMPQLSARFGWWGCSLIGIQALLLAFALSFFDDATGINVVFSSRGLWAIALVALLGTRLGNDERQTAGDRFAWRVIGSLLVTIAVVLAVFSRAS